jgi:multiple sugar transport system ATP-binding protein
VQRIGLRPEHLRVGPPTQGVPATVVHAEHLGDSSILHLQVEGVTALLNAKLVAGHPSVTVGQAVGMVPDAGWALPFDAAGRLVT